MPIPLTMQTSDFKKKHYYRGVRCAYCWIHLEYKEATVDHIVPITKGWQNSESNYTFACRQCNMMKWNIEPKTKAMTEFLKLRDPIWMGIEPHPRISYRDKKTIDKLNKLESTVQKLSNSRAEINGAKWFMTLASFLLPMKEKVIQKM